VTLPAAQTGSPGLALFVETPSAAPVGVPFDTTASSADAAHETIAASANPAPDEAAPSPDGATSAPEASVPSEEAAAERTIAGPERPPDPSPQPTGLLEIIVFPEADVIIDERLRGSTERFGPVEISAGEHDLVLRQIGFREYRETLHIKRGELSRRRLELQPVTGQLDFETVAGASIFVSGEPRGLTPLGAPIVLPAGRYLVELRKHGFVTWSGEVQIPADETLRLRINLVQQH
jgi:hypothetical protein